MNSRKIRIDAKHPQMKLEHRLTVECELDTGGVGTVIKAFDNNLLRTVALKRLIPEQAHRDSQRGRLIEEAQITAQLNHPHIVSVHELGVDNYDELYFSMDYVKGKTLSEVLQETDLERRSSKELFAHLQIFLKICDAVAYAHSLGIIHRDLKPSNIMIGEFGAVYVMDWGIARKKGPPKLFERSSGGNREPEKRYWVKSDGYLGTWWYMAPEQASNEEWKIDEQTDVFLLGGILYEILTHLPPYEAATLPDLKLKVIQAEIMPPRERVDSVLPGVLCQICMKALQADKRARYNSVVELRESIENYMHNRGHFESVHFKEGEVIIREGEKGSEAYVVTKGKVLAYLERQGEKKILREMGAGEVFGETAVLTEQPRTASVVALEPTDAYVIRRADIQEELKSDMWIVNLLKVLAMRFREKDRRVEFLENELELLKGRFH